MSENYIVINGKRSELTEEQMKVLGIEVKKNPFDRDGSDNRCYYTIVGGDVLRRVDINDRTDRMSYNAVNYFNDGKFAEQVALYQLLYRKLLKFAYDNGFEDKAEWDGFNKHWCIYRNLPENFYEVTACAIIKFNGVWFSSKKGAERAIKEVVEPFMKEHPEFVW